MKKKIFGIPIVLAGILLITMIGATAALISYFGQIQTEVKIDQGLKLDDKHWNDPVSVNLQGYSVLPFKEISYHELKSEVSEDITLILDLFCESIPVGGNCGDITHSLVKVYDAGIQDYVNPACDVIVTSTQNIRTDGIDEVADNEVVCVEAGEYDGFIVNKPVHLVALGEVTVNGTPVGSVSGMVQIASNNVILEGFIVDSGSKNYAVEGVTGGSNELILRNNKFIGNTHGVYINPSTNILIENNVFDVEGVAIGSDGHTGTIVRNNIFTETIGLEVMGASGVYAVSFTNNNIYTDAPLADYHTSTDTFDANNNFFAKGINIVGEVTASFQDLTAPFNMPANSNLWFASIVEMPAGMNPDYTYNLTTQVKLS